MTEITAVKVQNYKSIKETKWVKFDEEILTIVGGNEAGKSNFLEALSTFGQSRAYTQNELSNFTTENYGESNKENIPVVSVEYLDKDSTPFTYGREGDKVVITKHADGRYHIDPTFLSDAMENHLMDEEQDTKSEIKNLLSELVSKSDTHRIKKRITDLEDKLNEEKFESISSIESEIVGLPEDIEDYDKYVNEISELLQGITFEDDYILEKNWFSHYPEFELFQDIKEITNEEDLYDVSKDLQKEGTELSLYSELLSFAGLTPSETAENTPQRNKARKEDVSELITELLNKYWTQHHGEFKVDIEMTGGVVSFHIKDSDSMKFEQPFDRSTGFRWFLSFIINVIAIYESEVENTVILLDDPGVHLHPDAHKDLRNTFQNLAEDNKIIYSTHSPYMINKANLNSVRIVRREHEEEIQSEEDPRGTVVTKLGGADSPADDSLASVRMALGATFSDSLFASKKTILVEGHDDRLYLEGISELLEQSERTALDKDATIVDCGGASKVDYLSRIVDSEEYNYTVVLDDDEAGRNAIADLEDSNINLNHIHLVSEVMENTEGKNVTIEDLFPTEFFCRVASKVHEDDGIGREEFQDAYNPPNDGIVNELDNRIKAERGWMKSSKENTSDKEHTSDLLRKIEIARHIYKIMTTEDGQFDDETLDQFEELIENVNKSLKPSEENGGTPKNEQGTEAPATDD